MNVTLANGVKMPMLGYGVYQVTKEECEKCVLDAYQFLYSSQLYLNYALITAKLYSDIGKKTINNEIVYNILCKR